MTKIDIVSGFLGAGKTTLIKQGRLSVQSACLEVPGRPGVRAALRRPPGPPPRRRPALRGHRPGHPRPPPLDPPSLPRLQPSRNPRPRPCLRLPLRPCSRPCPCSCPCRPDPGCSSHRGSLYHIRFRSVGEMAGRSRP